MNKVTVGIFACSLITLGSAFSGTTDVEQLRKELEALKTASNQRIDQLEKALDAVKNNQPATNTLTKAETETIRKQLDRQTLDFTFAGYLRSGYGVDGHGNAQSAFQAPNADAKYRLGNEAETYLETTFITQTPPEMSGDKTFATQIRLAYVVPTSNGNNYETTLSLREAYGSGAGMIGDQSDAAFWAGQRFYSRVQVHMTDFWYRDMSGYGGGIEELDINGKAKLGLAWIGGSIDKLDSDGTTFANEGEQFRKDSIDLSLAEMDFLGGKFTTLLTYSYFNGSSISNTSGTIQLDNSHGASINLFQDHTFNNGIQNRLIFQLGSGAAYNFKGILTTPTGLNTNGLTSLDTDDFRQLRIIDDISYEGDGPINLSAVMLYQEVHTGTDTQGRIRWGSAGLRPVYHFDRNYSIATELGLDYTDQSQGTHGMLAKFTIAPQITPDASLLSRPAIRLFLTYAHWTDGFVDQVGGIAHAGKNDGISAGVQVETWW